MSFDEDYRGYCDQCQQPLVDEDMPEVSFDPDFQILCNACKDLNDMIKEENCMYCRVCNKGTGHNWVYYQGWDIHAHCLNLFKEENEEPK